MIKSLQDKHPPLNPALLNEEGKAALRGKHDKIDHLGRRWFSAKWEGHD